MLRNRKKKSYQLHIMLQNVQDIPVNKSSPPKSNHEAEDTPNIILQIELFSNEPINTYIQKLSIKWTKNRKKYNENSFY